MSSQNELKTEISANHQAFQEISSIRKDSTSDLLARGVGFEPIDNQRVICQFSA